MSELNSQVITMYLREGHEADFSTHLAEFMLDEDRRVKFTRGILNCKREYQEVTGKNAPEIMAVWVLPDEAPLISPEIQKFLQESQ